MPGVLYARYGGAWVAVTTGGTGPTGASGTPGAPGASTRQSVWKWVAAAVSTAQPAGYVGASSSTASSATYIELHPTDNYGQSWTSVITSLVTGNRLYIRQAQTNLGAWLEYNITGNPTAQGTNYRIPVAVIAPYGTEPEDGAEVVVAFSVPVGVTGPAGPVGADGEDGKPGSKIYSGTTAPTNGIGQDGDWYYLKTETTFVIYGPKTGGVWPEGLVVLGGAAPPPEAPPDPPPTSTAFKFMTGLVDRDGDASDYDYRDRPEFFGGFVANISWRQIEATEGTFVWTTIDSAITEAVGLGLKVRVRLYIGIDVQDGVPVTAAPTWLITRCGSVTVSDPNWTGAGATVKFWHSAFMPAWQNMINAVATRYDNDTTLVELVIMPGALIGGETMIQRYDNSAALTAAGYPGWEADQAIQRQAMDYYATKFTKTGLYYSLNGYQRIGTSTSVADSIALADYGISKMGKLMRPANNSVIAGGGGDALDDDMRGGHYRTIYTQMQQVWVPAGTICQLQTDNPGNISSKGGNLNDTIKYCAFVGASSVELPVSYTGESDTRLGEWEALFAGTAPEGPPDPPPSSTEILTVPNTSSPAWCYGFIKGIFAGDGNEGSGKWNYGGGNVTYANEVRRCALICNANGIPMVATGSTGSSACSISYTYIPSGYASLMPSSSAAVEEIQGWASGIMETEAATSSKTYAGGTYWRVEDNFTGVVGAEAESRTNTVAAQFSRLGCEAIVIVVSGGWECLVPQTHWDVLRVWPYFNASKKPPAPP